MTQRRRIILAGIGGAVVIAAIVLVFVVAGVQDARNYDPRVESYRRVGDDMHIIVVPVTVTPRDPLRRRAVLDSAGAPVPEITCPGGTLSCFIGR